MARPSPPRSPRFLFICSGKTACVIVVLSDIVIFALTVLSIINVASTGIEFDFGLPKDFNDFLKDSNLLKLAIIASIPLLILFFKLGTGFYAWSGDFDRGDLERYAYVSFVYYGYVIIERLLKVCVLFSMWGLIYTVCSIIILAHFCSIIFGYLEEKDDLFRYEGRQSLKTAAPKHQNIKLVDTEQARDLKQTLLQEP